MLVQLSKKDLENGLSIVSKAISQKTPLPILTHFLIEAGNASLKISATDLKLGIEIIIGAHVEEEGSFTTPAKTFQDIVSLISDETIQLIKTEEVLEIKCDNSSYNLMTLPADEFPIIPHSDEKIDFVIAQADLENLVKSVIVAAASQDETRAVLTGILVMVKDDKIKFVATDGRRLAINSSTVRPEREIDETFIIPSKTLYEISKFSRDPQDLVAIGYAKGQVFFRMGDVFIISRVLEGKYPQYDQVIPQFSDKKVTINKQLFLSAVKRTMIMSQTRENPKLVKMEINGDHLVLKSNTPDLGSAYERIPCVLEGEDIDIAFNGSYFLDALSNMKGDEVVIGLTDFESPGILRSSDDENYIYVIMPIVLKN